jgi:hypothetical protein
VRDDDHLDSIHELYRSRRDDRHVTVAVLPNDEMRLVHFRNLDRNTREVRLLQGLEDSYSSPSSPSASSSNSHAIEFVSTSSEVSVSPSGAAADTSDTVGLWGDVTREITEWLEGTSHINQEDPSIDQGDISPTPHRPSQSSNAYQPPNPEYRTPSRGSKRKNDETPSTAPTARRP